MYDSGVSVVARIILVVLVVLLGILFILSSSGCNCAHAEELQITTQNGLTHSFF